MWIDPAGSEAVSKPEAMYMSRFQRDCVSLRTGAAVE